MASIARTKPSAADREDESMDAGEEGNLAANLRPGTEFFPRPLVNPGDIGMFAGT
jgi:hypothetical protein